MAEKGKGYTIGVSSGMFGIAQGKEKEEYINVLKKVFWSSTKGVSFSQLDLESITEFNEPELKENVEKIKSLGIRLGIHGETAATTGIHTMPLDSALTEDYERAHDRLIRHIEGGKKLGAEYVLTHASESTPIIILGKELQPTKLVDFWGKPIKELVEGDNKIKSKIEEWLLKSDYVWDFTHETPNEFISRYRNAKMEEFAIQSSREKEPRQPTKEDIEKIEEGAKRYALNEFFKRTNMANLAYGGERAAYFIVAKWMELTKDPLWEAIVGKEKIENIHEEFQKWVPAVACKYIWGHFNPKDTKKFPDPKALLEKYGIDWIFETEMAKGGYETYMRVARIPHLCALASAIKSNRIGVAIDYQHLLSCNLNPLDEIDAIPAKSGGIVKVIHLSYPTPHVPSHIGIPLGSEAQLFIYKGLYALRKKGFYNGIIIFERGDPESVQQSVLTIRMIVQFLEKDVEPNKLPEEFYGMKPGGPEIARQLVMIREHALDPLKGLITVPEEEHGFFGKAAIEKGKGEEWKKEKYK
ncbi:MAG: hypothetical protein WA139_01565 [Candidatus Aenigmatarchaeota archaeon]